MEESGCELYGVYTIIGLQVMMVIFSQGSRSYGMIQYFTPEAFNHGGGVNMVCVVP